MFSYIGWKSVSLSADMVMTSEPSVLALAATVIP